MDNGLRRISSRIARSARKVALGVDFQDTAATCVFLSDPFWKSCGIHGIHRFMPVLAHAAGASVKGGPRLRTTHELRQSKYGIWNRLGRGVYDLVGGRWYQKRQLKKNPTTDILMRVD